MNNAAAAPAATYYRTTKGTRRHADANCANFRRSILLGDIIPLTAAQVADYAPCDVCCTGHEVAAAQAATEVKANAQCDNAGVTHPNRIQSSCRSCGKVGKVDRRTGSLRAHKPRA